MIIRSERSPENDVEIPICFLNDKKLSFKAKGILSFLISNPSKHKANIDYLSLYKVDGKDSIMTGLQELENEGYLIRKMIKDDKGKFQWETVINLEEIDSEIQLENKNSKKKIINKAVNNILKKTKNKTGLYRLYDKNKNFLYIGKSKCLGMRIPQSIEERGAYYFSYTLVDNYLNASIYEAYYIGKEQPKLNKEYADIGKPNMELDELDFTKIISFYGGDVIG